MNTETGATLAAAAPSQPAEQDLAGVVTDMLSAAGHPNPQGWLATMHQSGATGTFEQQRAAVNAAWQHLLGLTAMRKSISTFDERYCLLDRGTRTEWIDNFRAGVLPCILKHQITAQNTQ